MSSKTIGQPIVIDNGSGVIKAGIAGAERPKTVFANMTGTPKHERVMAGAIEDSHFVGKAAEKHRGLLKLKYPIDHGTVKDWANMEKVWKQVYTELGESSDEHPVLLTEAPFAPTKIREKMAQIF